MTLDTYSHVMRLDELPVSRDLELFDAEGACPGASPAVVALGTNRMVERAAAAAEG